MQYATNFNAVGPLNLRADMDHKRMLEMVCTPFFTPLAKLLLTLLICNVQLRFNKMHEFLAYYPQWTNLSQTLGLKYHTMCDYLQQVKTKPNFGKQHPSHLCFLDVKVWDELVQCKEQRQFAQIAKSKGSAGLDFIFFKMQKEGVHLRHATVRHYLAICEDSIFTKLLFLWDKLTFYAKPRKGLNNKPLSANLPALQ